MKNTLIVLIIAALGISIASAQVTPAESVTTHIKVVESPQNELSVADLLNGTIPTSIQYELFVAVRIADMNPVAKVRVKVGSTQGAADLANIVVDFANIAALPANASLKVEDNTLLLSLGHYTGNGTHFTQVVLENAQGQLSVPITE